jgi:hypothetical protein
MLLLGVKAVNQRSVGFIESPKAMAQSLKAVAGGTQNKAVPVKRALLSVSDKVGDAPPSTSLQCSHGYRSSRPDS